ncbi:hypothetical protein Q9Q94_12500 [Uliginosibacterium sp. 31-16]|uniref:hypothetical protein n=1 Tax=Uliginosibacterium sp. 31-16 TaxID=3068315 RepID=UPI00273E6D24|nr:hypothetical protein [Uliginosibacterium sp. 31-16]MDP5240355.1 hypothetical protein [Uliginosibacterium sp. 31-16]
MPMSYEEYLDEVTTLITEKYGTTDEVAIRQVMDAQEAGFFIEHDDDERLRTLERAHQDAATIGKPRKPARSRKPS